VTELNSARIAELMKDATGKVPEVLQAIGDRATYLWPTAGKADRACRGYSYDIPKEEQIRSALWAALQSSGELSCELEWNAYVCEREIPSVAGEIDIVGFDSTKEGLPVLLVEVKRAWMLMGWCNKLSEMRMRTDLDLAKLAGVRDRIVELEQPLPAKVVAYVFLVCFTDSSADWDRFRQELRLDGAIQVWTDPEGAPRLWHEAGADRRSGISTHGYLLPVP
jgi:hypothetical protein